MKKFYLQKFLISFFMIFLFGVFGYSQKYENLEQEKLKIENSKVTKVKSVNFSNKLKTINLEKAGALKLRDNISVLVASPNASEFNYLLIPLLKEFETDGNTINYTTTYDLASLTVEEMLDYHVVVTFNYEQWDQFITGLSSPIEWSDKLGEYIDSNGRLIEFEFVQDFDEWGLGGGAYINENKSPFTKATADVSGYGGSMGNVAQPDHPIMSGVTNVSTDYFYQNVTVRDNATLIASYTDGHPLCAINDQIVAFNIHPIGFYGTEWDPFIDVALKEDGCKMFYNSIVYLYNSIAPVGSPNFVTDVVVTPDSLGGNSINLSWKNPTLTAQDEPLTSLTSINIYINDDDTPAHIITNPVIGGAESWTATNLDYGVISFAIVGENENGEGKPYEVSSFVGLDAPAAVTDLTVTNSGSDGILSWTAPTIGINNGAIGSSTINYTIIRLPDNVTVATNYTSTTFTDNTIAELGFYAYKVIASNAQGEGGNATSNTEMLGPSIILPYLMGFEEDEQYDIWTIIDNNDDGSSWSRQTNTDNYEGYAMRYYYSTSNNADDWLITPRIYLENGKSYTLKFKARKSSDSYTEKFKVFLGTGLNIEDFTTQLFDVETSDQVITTEYQDFVINTNTIENSGGYHFAVQATSDINQFFLFVDDFEIFETLNNDIKAISLIAPKRALVGEEIELKVNLENIGSEIASGYSIKILDDNDNIIATSTLENSIDIEPNGIVTIPILYTPEDEGELSIYAKVEYAEDTNLSNNETEPITIYILPNQEGTAITQIGYGDYKSDNLPINFFYKNSFSQVIYKQNDISVTQGDVVGLTYIYSFANTLENKNIKIWLANTNKECFNSNTDWIPQSEFDLVFDGTVDIESGEGLLDFELITNAFSYTGGNIAIMVEKLDNSYKYGCNFYQTKTDTNNNVSIYYRKDSDPFDWSQEGTLVNCFPNIILTFNNVENDDPTPECNEVENLVATVEGNNVTLTWEDPVVKGGEVVLTEDFEAQTLPEDWTIIDADGDGYNWEMANYNSPEFSGANASSNFVNSASYINLVGPQTPDNYLITPELDLTEGGTLTYWVSAQDASYPDDHYGIFYSTTGNSVEDFVDTPLFEETITAKQVGPKGDRGTNMMGVWYQRTVELPVGTKYIAFRHYNCTDAYRINIDDVEITSGGNNGPISEFTFNIYKDGVLLTTTQSLTYEDVGLSEGTYTYCVEVVCDENTTSDQVCVEATVTDDSDCNPVQNLVATVNNDVVTLTWDNPVFIGREVVLTEDFESGVISSDWTIIDADGDGNNWFVYDYQYGSPHTGSYGVTSESYINSVGPQTPDNYLITPEINLSEGGTLTYYVRTDNVSYPAEHYAVYASTSGNTVEDFVTPLFEETLQGEKATPGTWLARTVALPAGTKYVAFRHYDCYNEWSLSIDNIEITTEGENEDDPEDPTIDLEVAFNVYRNGELVATTTETTFVEQDLPIGLYEYCVEVACSSNIISDQVCTEAEIKVCNPVQDLEATVEEELVTLSWNEPEESAQVDKTYFIYKDEELIGQTSELTFADYPIEMGTYNYCVKVDYGYCISEISCVDVEVVYLVCNPVQNLDATVVEDVVTLSWNLPAPKDRDVILSEGFEGDQLPEGWTVIDNDGDGHNWEPANYFNPDYPGANGSSNYVTSESYYNATWTPLFPDNFLITPELNLTSGGTLTYWVSAQDANYPADHYGVFVSTTGNNVTDFGDNALFEETLTAKHVGPKGPRGTNDMGTWYQKTVELPSGTKYVAFRHFNCTDQFKINIDDIEITGEGGGSDDPVSDVTFNIYKDGVLLGTTTSLTYEDTGVLAGTYNYCVEVVCDENLLSDQVCVEVEVEEIVDDICNPVRNLEGVNVDNSNVIELTWDKPSTENDDDDDDDPDDPTGEEATLTWSGAYDDNAVGFNGPADFDVAHRYEVSDLTEYVGWKLTKITFYPYEANCEYSLRAWTGSNAANLVLDQEVSNPVIQGETEVTVDTDVTILANEEFYIGYRCNTQEGFPAGIDAGPAVAGKGDLLHFEDENGNMVWEGMASMGLDYNFVIVGTIANSKGETVNLTLNDVSNRRVNGELSVTNNLRNNRSLLGYNIYLDNELIATIDDPNVTNFTDDFSHINSKDYSANYCVRAVYSTCESMLECVNVILYTTGIEDNANLSVYPNPANNIVNIDGVNVEKVYIYNNIGQLVEVLNTNQVDVSSYASGIYMFSIESVEGEVHKVKVVVQ